jgi:carbon-monoxide dehydrogenase medium subunit
MYTFYRSPTTLEEALYLKAKYGEEARAMAGATDLLLEIERGVRKRSDGSAPGVIDLTRIPGLATITESDGMIQLGPLVTHNQCVANPLIVAKAFPLARACWEVGAPQIRNRATVAGNLITASPANDTIAPLLALDARVTVRSLERGERTLPLDAFITGFRKVDLAPDELVTGIAFPALNERSEGIFIKLGLRRAQAISVVNVAVVVEREAVAKEAPVVKVAIALGAVAPTVVRASAAEMFLIGKPLNEASIAEAAHRAVAAAAPIDDIRSSAAYRRAMVKVMTARALQQIAAGEASAGWPEHPVLLWGDTAGVWPVPSSRHRSAGQGSVEQAGQTARVNGRVVHLPGAMTLLDSLRAAGLVGVKEGCAEGECGACTVSLDGMAVMACMAPAERAWGSDVITVEGLAAAEQLHPVQQAFVQSGGVQCGYCTPGFIVSAAKLLEERPHPDAGAAAEALTGNFCRCTGYQKIIDAVVLAGELNTEKA